MQKLFYDTDIYTVVNLTYLRKFVFDRVAEVSQMILVVMISDCNILKNNERCAKLVALIQRLLRRVLAPVREKRTPKPSKTSALNKFLTS